MSSQLFTTRFSLASSNPLINKHMTIKPWGSGSLSMSEIIAEFGGIQGPPQPPATSIPQPLSNYYAGGMFVPAGTVGFPGGVSTVIPSSGTLSFANFYGAQRVISFQSSVDFATSSEIFFPAGTWNVLVRLTGAGGGPGGWDANIGSNGGSGTSFRGKFTVSSTFDQSVIIYGSNPGRGGFSSVTGSGGGDGGTGFIAGGQGGDAGFFGNSGAGGGGGGASAIVWKPNTALSSFTTLAVAGGGGGGTGSGRFSLTQVPNTVSLANMQPRGVTSNVDSVFAIDIGPTFWWNPSTLGDTAYRRIATTKGQGGTNLSAYYPPGDDPCNNYDGGGAGGAGGGNGWSGGLTNSGNGAYRWTLSGKGGNEFPWNPPFDFCGRGGSQGFLFVNFSRVTAYSGSNDNSFGHAGYGGGGIAIAGGGNQNVLGGFGAASVIVTNDMSSSAYPG